MSRRTVRTPFNASASARIEDGRILAIGHDVFSGNLWSEQTYEGAALQTRTLYAGDNRLTRHRLAPLDIPVASSMRAPERRSVFWRWNARWTNSPRSSTLIRSS